jgi:Hemerythrin HHE cation binding domain
MAEDNSSAYLEALKAEHRELGHLVHGVEAALAAAAEEGWQGQRTSHVLEQLVTLRDFMGHHFAQEEEGGYLEEALSHAPRLAPQAARLQRQHPQLLARIDDVCDLARKRHDDASAWPAIHDNAQAAMKELLSHEAGENQLVQQAFNVDVGLAD